MTNDIASELSLLHTLKGAAYVSKLMEIAARKEFHPLEDDPCIFSVGGEKDADYPNLLNRAQKDRHPCALCVARSCCHPLRCSLTLCEQDDEKARFTTCQRMGTICHPPS